MNLPQLSELDVANKKVLVRVDFDVPFEKISNESASPEYKIKDDSRIKTWLPTVKYLSDKQASQVVLIGHIGRPLEGGDRISTFAIHTAIPANNWWPDSLNGFGPLEQDKNEPKVHLLENLRFYEGEEKNDIEFAKRLASFGDVFVNEAFAVSHRSHASIVGLPKLLPHAAGLRFASEVTNLTKVLENPKRPVISIISGVKEDKLSYVADFKKFSDQVLIAGRLPEYWGEKQEDKVLVARLMPDKEDITIHSIEAFEELIKKAGTIVLSGPIGKFEEEGHRQGTKRIFTAVADSAAFKVAGGGDTESAINLLGLTAKFDWISVGGGAMLEFLARGTLPGIAALLE